MAGGICFAINRLTACISSDSFNERGISYDLNGNITSLQRTMGSASLLDDLTYKYTDVNNIYTNQVQSITDASSDVSLFGYKTGSNQAYQYDVNGNIMQDNSKSISNISYNLLNLPSSVIITSSGTVNYLYDAKSPTK
jgi:hypothetical protein